MLAKLPYIAYLGKARLGEFLIHIEIVLFGFFICSKKVCQLFLIKASKANVKAVSLQGFNFNLQ